MTADVNYFVQAIVGVLVITDPVTRGFFFKTLTENEPDRRREYAFRIAGAVAVILGISAIAGRQILDLMGINLGAFIGPLIAGWLAQRYGWRIGFLAAAIGLPFGLLQFWLSRRLFNGAGAHPNRNDGGAGLATDWRRLWVALAAVSYTHLTLPTIYPV